MTLSIRPLFAAAIAAVALLCTQASSLAVDPPLTATRVASGLSSALYVTSPPGDYQRLFILEQGGRIKILRNGAVLPTPFFDGSSLVTGASSYLEYGVLGLAFHPDFAHNGYFYIVYTPGTTNLADWVLARYHVNPATPDVAEAAGTGQVILRINYARKQHRSGWIAFGPDGYLYAATGDGGESDPDNAASNTSAASTLSWQGKILRLDVNGPDGLPGTADDDGFPADALKHYVVPPTNPFAASLTQRPEIWAYGLRNSWRNSFDRLTGDMYLGDVGQSTREEVSFGPAGVGGRFYGWRCKEGNFTSAFGECTGTLPTSIPPILDYPRSSTTSISGASVTGGYMYRGCAMPALQGTYFFADWVSGKFYSFRYTPAGGLTALTNRQPEMTSGGASTSSITSFGEDAFGEIYFVKGAEVWKIKPTTAAALPDCNANGIPDACEIAAHLLHDRNHNGVPDECETPFCLPDVAGLGGSPGPDHALTVDDLVYFLGAFFAGNLNVADISGLGGDPFPDGQITPDDLVDYLAAFFAGCP